MTIKEQKCYVITTPKRYKRKERREERKRFNRLRFNFRIFLVLCICLYRLDIDFKRNNIRKLIHKLFSIISYKKTYIKASFFFLKKENVYKYFIFVEKMYYKLKFKKLVSCKIIKFYFILFFFYFYSHDSLRNSYCHSSLWDTPGSCSKKIKSSRLPQAVQAVSLIREINKKTNVLGA